MLIENLCTSSACKIDFEGDIYTSDLMDVLENRSQIDIPMLVSFQVSSCDEDLYDLHSTLSDYFLEYSYKNNAKYLLIIHGKGLNNKDGIAPIKKLVEKVLINSPHVLAASSANKKDGGHGATYLILKR